jgi:hypothetical protein
MKSAVIRKNCPGQISIFDELRKIQNEIEIFHKFGYLYAVVPDNYPLDKSPLPLGGVELVPGLKISAFARLDSNKRATFTMQKGKYLFYEGRIGHLLFFNVGHQGKLRPDNYRYAFFYINPEELFVMSNEISGHDIRAEKTILFGA